MKKIILSLAVIALTSVVAVGVTRAYFSSTATSTGNTFSAGTLTLSLSAGSGSTNTVFNITGMAPGVEVGPQTLNYSNTGSIDGIVKLNTTYAFVSGGHGPVNEHDFARHLIVTSGVTDTVPVQGWWAKHVIEKYNDAAAALADGAIFDTGSSSTLPEVKYLPTVYGLSKVTLKFEYPYNGSPIVWPSGATHSVALKLELDPNTTNAYQGAGISVSLNATMLQSNDTTF